MHSRPRTSSASTPISAGRRTSPSTRSARKATHFVEAVQFDGDLQEDGNEDKLAPKIEAIKDCAILYVAAIGGSGAARVVANNIHPMKVSQPEAIEELLDKLQDVLQRHAAALAAQGAAKDQERALDFEE